MVKYQLKGNEIVITGIEGHFGKEPHVPERIDGRPVTKISENAFSDLKRFIIRALSLTLSLMILCGNSYAYSSQENDDSSTSFVQETEEIVYKQDVSYPCHPFTT